MSLVKTVSLHNGELVIELNWFFIAITNQQLPLMQKKFVKWAVWLFSVS